MSISVSLWTKFLFIINKKVLIVDKKICKKNENSSQVEKPNKKNDQTPPLYMEPIFKDLNGATKNLSKSCISQVEMLKGLQITKTYELPKAMKYRLYKDQSTKD